MKRKRQLIVISSSEDEIDPIEPVSDDDRSCFLPTINISAASKVLNTDLAFIDKYLPKKSEDLAVHKSKLNQLRAWLNVDTKKPRVD